MGQESARSLWTDIRSDSQPAPDTTVTAETLLAEAAHAPWRSIADQDGLLAWGLSSSKGDPWRLPNDPLGGAPGQLGAELARRWRIGVHLPCATAAACSTGLYALLEAADAIEAGRCTRGLAGAVDGHLPPWLQAGFARLGIIRSDDHPHGFTPAAGAGVIALSVKATLTNRPPAAWRLTAGVRVGDARHETHFADPATLRRALDALWSVAPHPELIIAHLTGTVAGDAYEHVGLDAGPWRNAQRLALKSRIGHTLGASGAVELAIGLEAPVHRLWKLSLGFGGHLAAVACERTA